MFPCLLFPLFTKMKTQFELLVICPETLTDNLYCVFTPFKTFTIIIAIYLHLENVYWFSKYVTLLFCYFLIKEQWCDCVSVVVLTIIPLTSHSLLSTLRQETHLYRPAVAPVTLGILLLPYNNFSSHLQFTRGILGAKCAKLQVSEYTKGRWISGSSAFAFRFVTHNTPYEYLQPNTLRQVLIQPKLEFEPAITGCPLQPKFHQMYF